jgi:Flp pilus assembly protein TadB
MKYGEMSLELLKSNIEKEKQLLQAMTALLSYDSNKLSEKQNKEAAKRFKRLIDQLKIVNSPIPDLLNNIKFYPGLKKQEVHHKTVDKNLINIGYKPLNDNNGDDTKIEQIGIHKKDKNKLLKNLTKQNNSIKLEKNQGYMETSKKGTGALGAYMRASSSIFKNFSLKLVQKGYFEDLNHDLRKISSKIILSTYISMMLFSTLVSFVISIILFGVIVFFQPLLAVAVLVVLPILVFSLFYTYPMTERGSLAKKINDELPFIAIYMAAISTSGIEPSKIFQILVKTSDYPSTQREVKRLLNYINFYGYDLSTALRESSKKSPSSRLSMLFNGLATTIRSGGQLSDFLSKHAESLLFDYRLEREKYTKIAETFMDIYISILIAAPMIMMVLLVLISLTGYNSTLSSPGLLSGLIIGVVTLLNLVFLVVLNFKQPKF